VQKWPKPQPKEVYYDEMRKLWTVGETHL